MKNRIRKDKYRCTWCGDSFDNERDLTDHKKRKHNDYGACDNLRKINREMIAKEKQYLKDYTKEKLIPSPISEKEVRKIISSRLSDLTSMEILMRLDQKDEWGEQLKLLDLSRKFGVMCRKDIETTKGTKIGYDWDYLRKCVKKEEKIQGDIKSDRIVRTYNNKRDERDIQNERDDNQTKLEKGKYSNAKISKWCLSLADIRFGKSYIRDE